MNRLRLTKTIVFLAALIPLGRVVWKAFHDGLGANPIEVITHSTGDWTLILVLTTLAITPLRRITRQYWLIGVRRMIEMCIRDRNNNHADQETGSDSVF